MTQGSATVTVDNERLRITTWVFGSPGQSTGEHRHEFDYIVVPVTGGTFKVVSADGSEREMTQVAGTPYLGAAGTEHDVVCASDGRVEFVEIELKEPAGGG